MAYRLENVTIRTNNTPEGIKKTNSLWKDVLTGKMPVLCDSEGKSIENLNLISIYSNYEAKENGSYDFSIVTVKTDFIKQLEELVKTGEYKKYIVKREDKNIIKASQDAWAKVYADEKKGKIKRAYTIDYESTVSSKYTHDNKTHSYIYLSVKI